jgi:hypothetical protein
LIRGKVIQRVVAPREGCMKPQTLKMKVEVISLEMMERETDISPVFNLPVSAVANVLEDVSRIHVVGA